MHVKDQDMALQSAPHQPEKFPIEQAIMTREMRQLRPALFDDLTQAILENPLDSFCCFDL